jgi:glutathione S-transferase
MLQLYDFAFSHFSEKARWALDYKGVAYTPRHLLPGFHMRTTRKLAPRTSVPILVGHGSPVQGSTAIIDFLERICPDPPLTPADADQARAALQWEEYLDGEVGVNLRQWFYFHALPDRRRAIRFLTESASAPQRLLFSFAFPKIRQKMIEYMNVRAEPAQEAQQRFVAALDRIDSALSDRDFLVGDHFSRADLTACALLWPFCRPTEDESQVRALLPDPVYALRAQLTQRRFFRWVTDTYRQHRTPRSTRELADTRAAATMQ